MNVTVFHWRVVRFTYFRNKHFMRTRRQRQPRKPHGGLFLPLKVLSSDARSYEKTNITTLDCEFDTKPADRLILYYPIYKSEVLALILGKCNKLSTRVEPAKKLLSESSTLKVEICGGEKRRFCSHNRSRIYFRALWRHSNLLKL